MMTNAQLAAHIDSASGGRARLRQVTTAPTGLELMIEIDMFDAKMHYYLPSDIYATASKVTFVNYQGSSLVSKDRYGSTDGYQPQPDEPIAGPFDPVRALVVLIAAEAEFDGANLTA